MIRKVRDKGGHGNMVPVLKHGWLKDGGYHIDMEFCILNLEEFIAGNVKSALGQKTYFNPQSSKGYLGCLSLWSILQAILCGLNFIHSLHEFHRDLKPRNSNSTRRLEESSS